MKNICLKVSYIGTNFSGFQKQPGMRTVESTLQKGIEETVLHPVKLYYGGRTDTGVHSHGQVVNFYSDTTIDIGNLPRVINYHLPSDVSVVASKYVNKDFHSRYFAKSKHYRYIIYNGRYRNALYEDRAFFYPFKLNEKKLEEMFQVLIGERDFRTFMGRDAVVKDTIRRLDKVTVKRSGDIIVIDFYGKSFLKNMIRIMVGTCVKLVDEGRPVSELKYILAKKNRRFAGPTAPACGLYLQEICY